MRKKREKIFVVGGGTGGHLFPAIAIGEEFAERNFKVYLITDVRCKKYLSDKLSLSVKIIRSEPIKKGFISKVHTLISTFIGFMEALAFITLKKPKLVIGFGGYTTFPMLFAAKIFRIPIIIHEQNAYLGKANAFFAKYSEVIALSFPDTKNLSENIKYKTVITGNPVRKEMRQLDFTREYKEEDYLRLLVTGGSQGAKFLSYLIPNVIRVLLKSAPNLKISLVQQAAKYDWPRLKRIYKRFNIEFEISDFFHDLPVKLETSHLAIARAGASTISEFIAASLPAIYIPLLNSVNDHQFLNAGFIQDNHAGWYLEQSKVTPKILADKIIHLVTHPHLLQKSSNNLRKLQTNSEKVFVDNVVKIISKEKY